MAKALIGFFWAWYVKTSMHEKKRVRSLSNIEALRKPSRKISDVHAISADIHNYQQSTCFRNFSGFYVHRITANAVIIYPQKSHQPPPLRFNASTWLQRYEKNCNQFTFYLEKLGKWKNEKRNGLPVCRFGGLPCAGGGGKKGAHTRKMMFLVWAQWVGLGVTLLFCRH